MGKQINKYFLESYCCLPSMYSTKGCFMIGRVSIGVWRVFQRCLLLPSANCYPKLKYLSYFNSCNTATTISVKEWKDVLVLLQVCLGQHLNGLGDVFLYNATDMGGMWYQADKFWKILKKSWPISRGNFEFKKNCIPYSFYLLISFILFLHLNNDNHKKEMLSPTYWSAVGHNWSWHPAHCNIW